MAENGSDEKQPPFYKKVAKILVAALFVVPIIVLSVVDLVWLVVAFVVVLVFILLIPVFIILSPVLIILSPLLIILIPVFIILSPVLVVLALIILSPWIITLVLVLAYVFFWIYDYVNGKHPIGAGLVDKAREKIAEVTEKVKEWGKEVKD